MNKYNNKKYLHEKNFNILAITLSENSSFLIKQNYFQICISVRTVSAKSIHIRKICLKKKTLILKSKKNYPAKHDLSI